MSRRHAAVIALILGAAVALGLFAVGRTTHLGATVRAASRAQIAARERRLAAGEQALQRALAKSKAAAAAPAPAAPATAPRTVYVRPAPIVVHEHAGGESESDAEGGFDD